MTLEDAGMIRKKMKEIIGAAHSTASISCDLYVVGVDMETTAATINAIAAAQKNIFLLPTNVFHML